MKVWQAVLTFLSTLIGAGIVFIPYIVMQVGIPMALIICAIAVGFTHVSIVMYMRVMASVEIQIETIYDLGYYVVRNRFIVFLIAIILMI
jgi:amino acid permease